jgi:hypothetical protein
VAGTPACLIFHKRPSIWLLFKTRLPIEIAIVVFLQLVKRKIKLALVDRLMRSAQMAKQESLRTSECPVARTLESIGERWCLMIIREAFDDVRRFSEFQKI